MKRRTFLASGAALAVTPMLPVDTALAQEIADAALLWSYPGTLMQTTVGTSVDLSEASLEQMLINIAQSGMRIAAVPTMLIRDQG